MQDFLLSLAQKFGFPAAMCVVMLVGMAWILKWFATMVTNWIEKKEKQAEERELRYCEIISAQTAALNNHTNQAAMHNLEVKAVHDTQIRILEGIEQAVGRINGYTTHKE